MQGNVMKCKGLEGVFGLTLEAFACPAAVVSTFFSLARVMAMQQRLRRALAFLHLGLSEARWL